MREEISFNKIVLKSVKVIKCLKGKKGFDWRNTKRDGFKIDLENFKAM